MTRPNVRPPKQCTDIGSSPYGTRDLVNIRRFDLLVGDSREGLSGGMKSRVRNAISESASGGGQRLRGGFRVNLGLRMGSLNIVSEDEVSRFVQEVLQARQPQG